MSRLPVRLVVAALGVAAFAVGRPVPVRSQAETLASTLAAAGAYLSQLGRDLDGVVFEEDYLQQAQGQVLQGRRLKSDMAVLSDDTVGWVEFRDTQSVDGKPVADRQTRITDIFAHPNANALEQARRVVQEGARFNIRGVGFQIDRTINLPLAALMFLQAGNQGRSAFVRDRSDSVAGEHVMVVTFKETSKPRMIGTADDAAASGAFWISPQSGRVLRTNLRLQTRAGATTVDASIRVDYALVRPLHLWLPKDMEEHYEAAQGQQVVGVITGRALYENFRRFNVAVEEKPAQ